MNMKSLKTHRLRFSQGWSAQGAVAIGLLIFLLGGPSILTTLAEEKDAESEESAGATSDGGSDSDQGPDGDSDNGDGDRARESRSFTNDDLDRYHRPKPKPEGVENAAADPGSGMKAAEKSGPRTLPKKQSTLPPAGSRGHAPMVRTPLKVATPPSQDPLKKFRDKEARERFRTEQIQGLRDRIATLETRLEYLRGKRLAVVNPLYLMPKPPPGETPDDDAGLKPKELLDRIEAEIASIEAEIATTRKTLVVIETRFGHEANRR